jgi:16S rRNA (guanine527-N7)-methyltransferase
VEQAPTALQITERLREPLAELGLSLSDEQAARLAAYVGLLLPWNERINLTGARTAAEVLDRHLADAFALVPHLPAERCRLADVGAGAGFVGVGVAILRPDIHCVLLEPVGKKHAFLRAVSREVGLPNLEPRAERLAFHVERPDFVLFDVAVSRATWPPPEWLEHARALVRPGGLGVAYEGREPLGLPDGCERIPYRAGGRAAALVLRRFPLDAGNQPW